MPFWYRLSRGEVAERIQRWIALGLQLAIAGLVAGAAWEGQWLLMFTATLVLALTFGPALIEHHLRVQLPVEFSLATCLFLYAAFALGEVRQFYHHYWWWDVLLHGISALVLGLIGFLLVYIFYMTNRIRIAPIYVAAASFGFAVTLGTLWEIFEFLMDQLFGLNMQKSGLVDSMTDLMIDVGGALAAATLGYFYVRGGSAFMVDRLIRRFVESNPRFFP